MHEEKLKIKMENEWIEPGGSLTGEEGCGFCDVHGASVEESLFIVVSLVAVADATEAGAATSCAGESSVM